MAGCLLLFYDADKQVSEVVILNAQNLNTEPVARILLPQRVPYGFSWNLDSHRRFERVVNGRYIIEV